MQVLDLRVCPQIFVTVQDCSYVDQKDEKHEHELKSAVLNADHNDAEQKDACCK